MVKKLGLLIGFLILSTVCFSQNIIAYATVNTDKAYIGQPVKLIISVYTSTWFTSGIDLGNIKVDDALTVFFRSVSNSKKFSGKNYAGVSFYYNVFPTKDGKITVPSLSISVESPKPGDYKGIKRVAKTKPININITPIPLGYDPNKWLVATYLNVSQKWSASLKNIKVGDVVQRTINRSAGGTMSEFIPTTINDSISGVSKYPKRAKVNTTKTKTSISSNRSETVNYLFEKEGDIIIPSVEYMYWNFNTRKFYKKRMDSVLINVQPNPDLSMLASIKKSLQKETIEANETEEKPFLIFGFTPKTIAKFVVIVLVMLFVFVFITKHIIRYIKSRYKNYLQSERYAFKQVKKAIKNNDYFTFTQTSHAWLKKLNINFESLEDFMRVTNSEALIQFFDELNRSVFKENQTNNGSTYHKLENALTKARKDYLKQQHIKDNAAKKNNKWLNPTSID